MIEEIDADGSGDIDFNGELHALHGARAGLFKRFSEFVAVMSRKVETKYTADEVKAAFKVSIYYNSRFLGTLTESTSSPADL